MAVQVQADLLADAESLTRRERPVERSGREAVEEVVEQPGRASTGRYLLGSIVLVQAAWIGTLMWIAVRMFS